MHNVTAVLGNVAKHILVSIERAFRVMAITGFIVAIVVGLGTEAIGSLLTQQIPAGGFTHLAAAALAIAFGYAVAVTVAIGEILRGLIKSIELVVQESERAIKIGLEEVEGMVQHAEGEALHVGRAALHDAAAVGRGVIGGAESLEHGVAQRVHGAEQGLANHLPGRRTDA